MGRILDALDESASFPGVSLVERPSPSVEAAALAARMDALRPSIEHPLLRRLAVGEEVGHIRRLASKPSAFYVRSLLSQRDCDAIKAMAQAANMTQARTYGGGTTARRGGAGGVCAGLAAPRPPPAAAGVEGGARPFGAIARNAAAAIRSALPARPFGAACVRCAGLAAPRPPLRGGAMIAAVLRVRCAH